MKITDLNTLKEYSRGAIVELPPFAEGQPFVARLKRPSVLALAKAGKIPNELLNQANKLFLGTGNATTKKDDPLAMKRMFELFDVLCEATFVEPTYKELKDNGIELTDDQYTFIFQYTQSGVDALTSFRKQSTGS